jgi:DNA polymerase-3 subunit alpha
MGIKVLPPDVNISGINFTVDGKNIRFGLGAVKSLGEVAAQSIKKTREKEGKFKDFLDFCVRAGGGLNSRILENLCKAGAFDSFGIKRKELVGKIHEALSIADAIRKDSNENSLFADVSDFADSVTKIKYDMNEEDYHERELLAAEKEILGFYVIGHPLGEFKDIIKAYSTASIKDMKSLPSLAPVRIGGIISSIVEKRSKKTGNRFAEMEFEDFLSSTKCFISPEILDKYLPQKNAGGESGEEGGSQALKTDEKSQDDAGDSMLKQGKVCFVNAYVETANDSFNAHAESAGENDKRKLRIMEIMEIKDVLKKYTSELHLRINEANYDSRRNSLLSQLCGENPGKTPLVICATTGTGENVFIETEHGIEMTSDFIRKVKEILGEESVHIKTDKSLSDINIRRNQFYKRKNEQD